MRTILFLLVGLLVGCQTELTTEPIADLTTEITKEQRLAVFGEMDKDEMLTFDNLSEDQLEWLDERIVLIQNRTPECTLPPDPCFMGLCGCVYCCYCVDHNNTVICETHCDPSQCL